MVCGCLVVVHASRPFNCFASLAPAARDELNIYLTVIWACWGAFMLIGIYIAFYFYADAACVSRWYVSVSQSS